MAEPQRGLRVWEGLTQGLMWERGCDILRSQLPLVMSSGPSDSWFPHLRDGVAKTLQSCYEIRELRCPKCQAQQCKPLRNTPRPTLGGASPGQPSHPAGHRMAAKGLPPPRHRRHTKGARSDVPTALLLWGSFRNASQVTEQTHAHSGPVSRYQYYPHFTEDKTEAQINTPYTLQCTPNTVTPSHSHTDPTFFFIPLLCTVEGQGPGQG